MRSCLWDTNAGEAARRKYVLEAPLRSSILPPGEIVLFVGSITRLNSVGVYVRTRYSIALPMQANILELRISCQCPMIPARRILQLVCQKIIRLLLFVLLVLRGIMSLLRGGVPMVRGEQVERQR